MSTDKNRHAWRRTVRERAADTTKESRRATRKTHVHTARESTIITKVFNRPLLVHNRLQFDINHFWTNYL